jgi:putative transposase
VQLIDSTTAKAHRSAAGGKGGPISRRSAALAAGERQKSMLLSMVAAVPARLP